MILLLVNSTVVFMVGRAGVRFGEQGKGKRGEEREVISGLSGGYTAPLRHPLRSQSVLWNVMGAVKVRDGCGKG